jgi:hypothetical protein
LPDAQRVQGGSEGGRRVVAAAIRMKDRIWLDELVTGGHEDGLFNQWCLVIIVHRIPDDFLCAAVNHRRQK